MSLFNAAKFDKQLKDQKKALEDIEKEKTKMFGKKEKKDDEAVEGKDIVTLSGVTEFIGAYICLELLKSWKFRQVRAIISNKTHQSEITRLQNFLGPQFYGRLQIKKVDFNSVENIAKYLKDTNIMVHAQGMDACGGYDLYLDHFLLEQKIKQKERKCSFSIPHTYNLQIKKCIHKIKKQLTVSKINLLLKIMS